MERPEHQTEIYKKAIDIQNLVKLLTDFIRESDFPKADDFNLELITEKLSEMEENAQEIPILISDASMPDRPYDFRMENAVFVKSAALELIEYLLCIEELGLKDIDYFEILYDEIEALRVLFIDWIKSFELWKYGGEDWGLFSPEGIELVDFLEDGDDDFDDEDDEDDEDDDE